MSLTIQDNSSPIRIDDLGVARVGTTRITLDTVIGAFNSGALPEQIVFDFPVLRLADVYLTVGYYLRHKPEVDAYLTDRVRSADELRARIEAEQGDVRGIRERLLARQAEKQPAT